MSWDRSWVEAVCSPQRKQAARRTMGPCSPVTRDLHPSPLLQHGMHKGAVLSPAVLAVSLVLLTGHTQAGLGQVRAVWRGTD